MFWSKIANFSVQFFIPMAVTIGETFHWEIGLSSTDDFQSMTETFNVMVFHSYTQIISH